MWLVYLAYQKLLCEWEKSFRKIWIITTSWRIIKKGYYIKYWNYILTETDQYLAEDSWSKQ